MSAALQQSVAQAPAESQAAVLEPDRDAVPLSAFLDQVAELLRDGLPKRLWVEATVVDVKASTSGFTLELSDPALERGSATLRAFLSNAALAAIRQDLALALDPLLLVGLTTCLRITPHFSRRWHLGARVEALSRDASASLKARLLERVITTLKRERLWDRQHALPRPRDITRIAVIHPAGAAGWGDIAGELNRWERAGIVRVRSHPAPFEGEHASAAVVAALGAASLPLGGHGPDLVLVVRGGGARTSLAVLDDEAIARAILACPVPVICGVGHAADRSLAGDVSWRGMDTPSKAIALVAEIIGAATRAAAADWDAVFAAASTMMLTHAGQLEMRQQAVTAAASHAIAAAGHHLAQLWSVVRIETRAVAERTHRMEGELERHLAAILARVPQVLEAGRHTLQQLLQTGLGRAATLLGRMDGGDAVHAQVGARAEAVLEREAAALQRCRDEIEAGARRQLNHQESALDRTFAEIEAGDLGRLMVRGFVAVTDDAGRNPCCNSRSRKASAALQ